MQSGLGKIALSTGALCTLLHVPAPSHAQDMAAESLAKLGVVFATNSARMLRDAPGDRKPPATKLAAARKIIDQQRARETEQRSATVILDATLQVALSATTVSIAATGVGAPAAIAFHVVSSAALDLGVGEIDSMARETVTKAAARNRAEILQLAGAGSGSFEGIPPAELRQRLSGATGFLEDISRGLPEDADGTREYLKDMAVDVLRSTTMGALDQIASQGVDIDALTEDVAGIQAGLNAHKTKTAELLAAQELAINEIDVAVSSLAQNVNGLDARLAAQEHNQAYVNDFVLSTMPPAAKAAALRSGFMGERFSCPEGETECDGLKAKEDLIEQFEAEAELQEQTAKLGEIAQGLNDITTIANALGVPLPQEVQDLSGAAGVGMQAFNHFASGNYLGAVASLTGMMGGGGDADQARHEAMMRYLAAEFENLNQRLKTIETRLAAMDAKLDAIAIQMDRYYRLIDTKLDILDWKLDQALSLLQYSHWQPWNECQAMISSLEPYIIATGLGPVLSPDTNVFEVQSVAGQHALACRNHASSEIRSVEQVNYGNFLNAKFAMQKIVSEGGNSIPTDIRTFVDNIYSPTYDRLIRKLSDDAASFSAAFDLLAYPAATMPEIQTAYAEAARVECGVTENNSQEGVVITPSVRKLLCEVGKLNPNPDVAASSLMQNPMLTEEAMTIAGYIRVLAPIIDLYDQSRSNWVRPNDLNQFITDLGNKTVDGESLIAATIGMLDAVIVSYNLRSGGLTAVAFADLLRSPLMAEPALEAQRQEDLDKAHFIMHMNPILARNTALVLLRDAYGVRDGSGRIVSREVRQKTYRDALSYGERHPDQPDLYLKSLFGAGFAFDVQDGVVRVLLSARDGATLPGSLRPSLPQEIRVEMPEPGRMKEGRLHYSYRMQQLLAARSDLKDRLFGYQVFDMLTVEERAAVLEGVGG